MYKRLMRTFVLIAFFSIIFFVNTQKAFAGTGFLGGPMWINPEIPHDGDLVILSALFHNAESNQLTGEVLFYDGNVLLGRKTITISSGGIATATVSFKVGAGDHVFSATMGNLIESLSNGKTEPFALSPQTVKLPNIFVPSKAGSTLNAEIVPGPALNQISPNNPLSGVINQINDAKGNVLSKIPDSALSPVTDSVSSIDTWRTKNSDALNQAVKDSSLLVKDQNLLASDQQKKYGKVSPTTNFIDRPFAYVKLFFFTLLLFLYSHSFVFYGAGLIVIYLIAKFILSKISRRKKTSKASKKPIKKD